MWEIYVYMQTNFSFIEIFKLVDAYMQQILVSLKYLS